MPDPILIIGTRAIAAVLGVGRNRLLAWLNNPEMGLPASNRLIPGRWVATRQNLLDWSNSYFSPSKGLCASKTGTGLVAKQTLATKTMEGESKSRPGRKTAGQAQPAPSFKP